MTVGPGLFEDHRRHGKSGRHRATAGRGLAPRRWAQYRSVLVRRI